MGLWKYVRGKPRYVKKNTAPFRLRRGYRQTERYPQNRSFYAAGRATQSYGYGPKRRGRGVFTKRNRRN